MSKELEQKLAGINLLNSLIISKNCQDCWEPGFIEVSAKRIVFEIKTDSDITSNTIIGIIGEIFTVDNDELERIYGNDLPAWQMGTTVQIDFSCTSSVMKKI
jgi:hypothetical protein